MKHIKSEMAGTIIEIMAKEGDEVRLGHEVALIESMKMEVPLVAKAEGVVKSILKSSGDFVNDGDVIFELA